MYEIRQIIHRLRLGESNRKIGRSQGVGRDTVAAIRRVAAENGWLDASSPLPEDARLAESFKLPRPRPQNLSSIEPYRDEVLAWRGQNIPITTMRAALARKHGFAGSVHSLYRFLERAAPQSVTPTVMLDFPVAELAQVDFGAGPRIPERRGGTPIKTWFFIMTLAWSRHQYAEIVTNQSVETWLACHRHAFEWFNGVPR